VTHKYYQDFDHFVIDVADKKQPDNPFRFTFTRQGLLQWKLTGLTIPLIYKQNAIITGNIVK
jgi:hypothetical protein